MASPCKPTHRARHIRVSKVYLGVPVKKRHPLHAGSNRGIPRGEQVRVRLRAKILSRLPGGEGGPVEPGTPRPAFPGQSAVEVYWFPIPCRSTLLFSSKPSPLTARGRTKVHYELSPCSYIMQNGAVLAIY